MIPLWDMSGFHFYCWIELKLILLASTGTVRTVGWLEFNFPFEHKYGYIRDEYSPYTECSPKSSTRSILHH